MAEVRSLSCISAANDLGGLSISQAFQSLCDSLG